MRKQKSTVTLLALALVLALRRCPEVFRSDAEVRRRAAQLGDEVQRYGNVLEERLRVGMPIE